MDIREGKLPAWVQAELKRLRDQLAENRAPLIADNNRLQTRLHVVERKLGALEELLTCAAKGGHATATEIIKVLESYSLTATPEL